MQRLVDAAHADGSLAEDIAFCDVGSILVRLSRPLPSLPPEVDTELAHRHLDLFLAGMRAGVPQGVAGGKGLQRSDLHALRNQCRL